RLDHLRQLDVDPDLHRAGGRLRGRPRLTDERAGIVGPEREPEPDMAVGADAEFLDLAGGDDVLARRGVLHLTECRPDPAEHCVVIYHGFRSSQATRPAPRRTP